MDGWSIIIGFRNQIGEEYPVIRPEPDPDLGQRLSLRILARLEYLVKLASTVTSDGVLSLFSCCWLRFLLPDAHERV